MIGASFVGLIPRYVRADYDGDAIARLVAGFETKNHFIYSSHQHALLCLLAFPTYVLFFFINKALFGDAHTHKDSTVPQAESYIHRFGPGLLLYWFGHAPLQKTTTNDLMVTGWTLPDQWLLPTGETIIFYPAT